MRRLHRFPAALLVGLLAALAAVAAPVAGRQAPVAGGQTPVAARQAPAATITLAPLKDNTLYESEGGTLSNGKGQHFFAGQTASGGSRRAVLAFDIAGSLPPGATVTAATLTLNMSRTSGGQAPVTLRALLKDWGEGASDALGEEGGGAAAAPGDATWRHTRFDTAFWTNPGGDFGAAALATTPVAGEGAYTWSSPALVADVQRQLDNPSAAFGWILIGGEAGTQTAKRFDSREHPTAANRPRLTITYLADAEQTFLPAILRN